MIYKERAIPLKLKGLQSLIQRLSSDHPFCLKVQEEIRKRAAGFSGEEHFDKYISDFRPTYPYALLKDISLQHAGVYFQIDALLITPSIILIFEIKNLAGKIVVKSNPTQFIQEHDGIHVIRNPIVELERKEIFLSQWTKERGVNVPVRGIVALAYNNEISIMEEPSRMVVSNQEVPILLYKTEIKREILNSSKIMQLANLFVEEHREYNPFPLAQTMKILPGEIATGVICGECGFRGMRWKERKWICPDCLLVASDSHQFLLNEWFMLMDSKITNRDFRRFAHVKDLHVAKRLLRKSDLVMKGHFKTAYYIKETI